MNFLFTSLLKHWLFAGTMFFAAGAPALGGVADSGGLDDGAGVGDAAESDPTAISDTGVADGEVAGREAVSQESAKPSTHRAVLENFTKSEEFKTLQTAKPEVAKAITRLQQSLRTVSEALAPLGGLKNAQQIAKVLEGVGGIESITEMQGRLAEIDEIDAKLEAGDPAYITDIATNMPEQFQAMMPHALDKWSELNPEGFTQFIAQNVVGNLFSDDPDAPGIANMIARAYEQLADKPEAQKILKSVYGWCKAVRTQATTKPKVDAKPVAGKIDQRAADLDKRELQIFDRNASTQVESYSLPKMQSEIKRQFGDAKIPQETIDDMLQSVTQEMTRRAIADKDFQRQVGQARGKKDEKRLVELSKAFADKNIPDVAKLIYGRRYRGMNIGQKVAAGKPDANKVTPIKPQGKAQVIAVKPKDSDLILSAEQLSGDQRKAMFTMGYKSIQQAIMSNIGFTKSGKVVQWQKD